MTGKSPMAAIIAYHPGTGMGHYYDINQEKALQPEVKTPFYSTYLDELGMIVYTIAEDTIEHPYRFTFPTVASEAPAEDPTGELLIQ